MKQRSTSRLRVAPIDPPTAPPANAPDDFLCLRFGVQYPSIDCAFRTRYRTCPGCNDCDQGRFNLKRHSAAVAGLFSGSQRRG